MVCFTRLRIWLLFSFLLWVAVMVGCAQRNQQAHFAGIRKGKLLYEKALANEGDVAGWVMEGPGTVKFSNGWMEMFAPEQEWHHVFWCPENFPESFVAEWEMQNLNTEGGLAIVFFAAHGEGGKDIFDPSLPARDGTFKYYTRDKILSYHVSYYANNPKNPDRELSHLRKNNMFALVQEGDIGIPKESEAIHRIRLVKQQARIVFYVDERKIIDWTDDGQKYGPVYGEGRIGFRQMQWSKFRYRNFRVWAIEH